MIPLKARKHNCNTYMLDNKFPHGLNQSSKILTNIIKNILTWQGMLSSMALLE